jgi:hypothetical protein
MGGDINPAGNDAFLPHTHGGKASFFIPVTASEPKATHTP